MPSSLQQGGAQLDKPSKFGTLHINRFFTGLWSNRSPLREGGVPYLYERFYSGSRFDSVYSGSNTELTTRLTWARRPGHTIYNSQTFSRINTFYEFLTTNPYTGAVSIRIIADTATAVYDATGPSTKTLLFTKGTGAGQTSFQSVGNTLYAGDGVETWKYVWAPAWVANTNYTTGNTIIDSNGNLQAVTGIVESFPGQTQSVSVLNNVVTIAWGNDAAWSASQLSELTGQTVALSSFASATFLNSQTEIISSVSNAIFGGLGISIASLTFSFTHANYGPTTDTGTVTLTSGTAESGGSTPSWSATVGSTTTDGTLVWTNKGPAVQNWGIVAPLTAPGVANVANTVAGTAWVANTYYSPSLAIVDSNNNVQILTTGGQTGTSVPTWSSTPGATTADSAGGGTAVWTCQAVAATSVRVINTAYVIGQIIAVQYSYTKGTLVNGKVYGYQSYGPYYYLFQCTTGGTSSSAATSTFNWQNATIQDGSVVWTNIGPWVTRTASASAGGTATVKGNITNSEKVSLAIQVVDSNGNYENIIRAGESGATAPTWVTSSGQETTDNQATWSNGGPAAGQSTLENTGAWQYGYAFMNSVTGHVSTMSPASSLVTLSVVSYVNVTGAGDPNYLTDGVDTIVIYRTVQGGSTAASGGTFFQLTTIPAPANGANWSYQDASPDPPATGAILNNLIEADVTGTNAPPPSNLIGLSYHLGRVWGISEEFAQYSQVGGEEVGVGAESWSALNYFQMPATPIAYFPSAAGIFILTNANIWLSSGTDGNGNPLDPTLYLDQTGILSPNVFAVNGSVPGIFASDSTLQVLDPSAGVQWVSGPIADKLAAFSPSTSYLTWHSFGTDQAWYMSDGETGWYRLAPLSAPESGYAWSTFATITGGCGCVKSVVTSPGIRQLLIGPASSGQILTRNLNTFEDNGTPYAANLVIGSIVLAQPNQCAEVVSITTECPAIGSHPTVGILGDEISGTFENLTQPVNDPPFLVDSQSIYADRFYFDTLMSPAWMRHLMIDVSWPAENDQSEIFTYSIFGALHSEG